jgi:elongation factor 2
MLWRSRGDVQLYPDKGNIAFGSSSQGWAFTLRQFATRYSQRFSVDKEKMAARLWGDDYFDPQTKKWTKKDVDEDGNPLERAFNMFVLDPIFRLFDAVLNDKEEIDSYLQRLSISLTQEERDLKGIALLQVIMHKFLPADQTLLEMIVIHLPPPTVAQQYRVDTLYEGPMNDESAIGMRECNRAGPLVVHISKMIPTSNKGHFYGLGRVFSGTLRVGAKIRIQGPEYTPGKKRDLYVKATQRPVFMMGFNVEDILECPAGNIVGIAGVDGFLLRSGTLTDSEITHNIKELKLSTTSIVQAAVDVKNAKDLPKLIESLKCLARSSSSVQTWDNELGEHIIGGNSENQLETCFKVRFSFISSAQS